MDFLFDLDDDVTIIESDEIGLIVGRAVEAWWTESALVAGVCY